MKHSGYSLIELLAALAIIGILTAVALPSYQQYVLKSRRTDAKTGLLDLAAREERYYSVNNSYTNSASGLGYSTNNTPLSVALGNNTSDYTMSVSAFTATSYTLQAAPLPVQAGDACGTYQLDNLGNQLNISPGGGGGAVVIANCW